MNLIGLFLCTQAAAAQMVLQGRGGRIVNVTSIDALHPSSIGLAHYDASKHGAWGFTKNVALELAKAGSSSTPSRRAGSSRPARGSPTRRRWRPSRR